MLDPENGNNYKTEVNKKSLLIIVYVLRHAAFVPSTLIFKNNMIIGKGMWSKSFDGQAEKHTDETPKSKRRPRSLGRFSPLKFTRFSLFFSIR